MPDVETLKQLAPDVAIVLIFVSLIVYLIRSHERSLKYLIDTNKELTDKFILETRDTAESRVKLMQAIDANTQATKASSDNLSRLMLKVLSRTNDKKDHEL